MENLGFQGTLNKVITIWKRNSTNWQERRIPWRPSSGDIDIYRKLIDEKLPGKILIMGATPEMRDLIASTNNKITLVDICPEMIASTSRLLKISHPEDETHVIADWCALPFPDSHFDLIVGDCLWWLFSSTNQERLSDELTRVLKANGIMVTRSHFCNANLIGADLGKMIREHLSLLTGTSTNKNDMRELLMSHILDATTTAESQRFNTKKALAAIEKILSDNECDELHRSFLEDCSSALRGRVDWSSQTREQVLDFLTKRFVVENEVSAQDYEDSHFFPILKLKKKSGNVISLNNFMGSSSVY